MNTEVTQNNSLHDVLSRKVNDYLNSLDTKQLTNFHELYLAEVEAPLLEVIMNKTKYNQVKAAKMLGISRGTLRKKLVRYFDDKYCGRRGE